MKFIAAHAFAFFCSSPIFATEVPLASIAKDPHQKFECTSLKGQQDINCNAAQASDQTEVELNKAYEKFATGWPKARRAKLKKAQLLWIKYRDTLCAFEGDTACDDNGQNCGSMSSMLRDNCKTREAKFRIQGLKDAASQGG